MTAIVEIRAREILDSRGNPTVEADVLLESGAVGRAAVPSGASTGSREAHELRDGEPERYLGKGVQMAVANIHGEISDAICGMNADEQMEIDEALCQLDGTENKSRLGANAILAVSMAAAKAAACHYDLPLFRYLGGLSATSLPVPMMNILNGGVHADNAIDIQEFMIVPTGAVSFEEAMRAGAEIFHHLKARLKASGLSTNVGDEGGFAPALQSANQALDCIMQAIEKAGYTPGVDVHLALDSASTEFYRDGFYHLEGKQLDAEAMISYYQNLLSNYPIISIEDPMAENDFEGWASITAALGKSSLLVGDDLFVTNPRILMEGIEDNLANALLVKVNQIGTLSETLAAIKIAKSAQYKVIVSHRSGETEDNTIAHIAVGAGAEFIKTGSLCRSDRLAKYNELLRISEILG